MLRSVARFYVLAARQGVLAQRTAPAIGVRSFSAHKEESHAEIDAHYEAYFKRPEIDGWEIRKGLVEIQKRDMIPNPQICDAILRACRRVNDYALTTRFLEALKLKCTSEPALHDYILKEIAPTMAELGISTVEELGYDKPELWLQYYDD